MNFEGLNRKSSDFLKEKPFEIDVRRFQAVRLVERGQAVDRDQRDVPILLQNVDQLDLAKLVRVPVEHVQEPQPTQALNEGVSPDVRAQI